MTGQFDFSGPVYASAGPYKEEHWELDEDGNPHYIGPVDVIKARVTYAAPPRSEGGELG